MSIPFFLVYIRHFLNHTTVFLYLYFWRPLAQRPRQPPISPNGSASPDKSRNLPSNVLQQITQVQKCVDKFLGRQLFSMLNLTLSPGSIQST